MPDTAVTGWPAGASAMTPVPHRVRTTVRETRDSATVALEPVVARLPVPLPGQFMMLYAFGVGEVAMSVSGVSSASDGTLIHTVRAVGAVSRALHDAPPGTVVGVRGPFGTDWGLPRARGRDLVIVAGGIGLAPLRPVVLEAVTNRERYGRVILIVGARSRAELPFAAELDAWDESGTVEMHRTIDVPVQGWTGETGLVTQPLRRLELDPARTTAFLCGPERMMSAGAEVLMAKSMAAKDIRVSLERNMQCGVGWCGHCQLGPLLLCRDGPVIGYDVAAPLLTVEQL